MRRERAGWPWPRWPRWLRWPLLLASALWAAPPARADALPEYRLKAAFVYNFIAYTDWPAAAAQAAQAGAAGAGLNLCLYGADPFGPEIDGLQGKLAAGRSIAVLRKPAGESLKDCQVVFVCASAIDGLPRLLDSLRDRPVLTLADSPGAMRRGVMLNLGMQQGKVSFEANLQAARSAGLELSSKLLRLATEVKQ